MSSALGGDGDHRRGGSTTGTLPGGLAAAFERGGEMGARLRDLDWAATGLGAPGSWPVTLRQAITMMLASGSQTVLFWGEHHLAFYNDAYLPTIGTKHPYAIGQPARRHWAELWHVLEPLFTGVRRTGRSFRATDHPFLLERHGFLEETYFEISYDPVWGEDGSVEGVYCVVNETTGRVLGERRLRLLTELATRLTDLDNWSELARRATEVLDTHRADVPFALLYLRPDESSDPVLAGCGGVPRAVVSASPDAVGLPEPL
ncbi:MAG TPA: histidine kinase, partial [Micromonospora sp.]